jgi:hypothetical protein
MYFPSVMASPKIKARTVTRSIDGVGSVVVYQDTFNNERTLSSIIHEVISSVLGAREVQEIKVTEGEY